MSTPLAAVAPSFAVSSYDSAGFLRVKVLGGKGLGGKASFENVYVTVSLCDAAETTIKRSAQKTHRNKKGVTEWNEVFDLILDPAATLLKVKATYAGTLRKDRLGSAYIPVSQLLQEVNTLTTVTLLDSKNQKTVTGALDISHSFFPAKGAEGRVTQAPMLYTASKREIAKSERRTQTLSKVFDSVPATEKVIQKYECALDGKPPARGVLCLTQHYIFFYSRERKVSLRLVDIETIEQKSTPTGGSIVKIVSRENKEHLFGNFRKTERVVEQIKRGRIMAQADSGTTPIVDVSALKNEDDVAYDSEAVDSEVDSSEPETTDDENNNTNQHGKSPRRVIAAPAAGVYNDSTHTPVKEYTTTTISAPSSTERHPGAPEGIMSAEISAVLRSIEEKRSGATVSSSSTTVINPVVTETVQVAAPVKAHLSFSEPQDDVRELNLSPTMSSPRNDAYSSSIVTKQEVVPNISSVNTVNPVVYPLLNQMAQTSNILASAPKDVVNNNNNNNNTSLSNVVPSKQPMKTTVPLVNRLSSTEQQILLLPVLSAACFLTFFVISSWSGTFNGLLSATVLGALTAVLQPGNLASLSLGLLCDISGQKDLIKSEPTATVAQLLLSGMICLPLQLVSTGLVGGVYLGFFGGIISSIIIGSICIAFESQMGVKSHKDSEKKKH